MELTLHAEITYLNGIHDDNMTERGQTRSVIIRVINKIGRLCRRSLILLISHMITD